MKYVGPLEDRDIDIASGFYNVELIPNNLYWIGGRWTTREQADYVRVKQTCYRIRVKLK